LVKVILVRHGETDWNESRRIQGGSSNPPLNERGREQAEGLALRLRHEKLRAIYASALQRSLDTAKAIAYYHQIEVDIEPSLKEIEAGQLEGVSASELGKHLSEFLTTSIKGKALLKAPGGESLLEVQERAWCAIQQLARQHPDGVLVLVSHYFTILTVVCSVLGLPLSQIGRFRLGTGSISIINFDDGLARLESFNESCYQP
jgi:probable phosphoglycerate mutase